jgi:hypothetical protein
MFSLTEQKITFPTDEKKKYIYSQHENKNAKIKSKDFKKKNDEKKLQMVWAGWRN